MGSITSLGSSGEILFLTNGYTSKNPIPLSPILGLFFLLYLGQ